MGTNYDLLYPGKYYGGVVASLTWSWKDYWNWYLQIEEEKDKTIAIREILKDNWMANLSMDMQVEVMQHAPMEVLQHMHKAPHIFKLDAIRIIEAKLQKAAGVKPAKRQKVYSFGVR